MKVDFRRSFLEDLKNVDDKRVLGRVKQKIEEVEHAKLLSDIPNIKKLKTANQHYRIRVGNYRLGLAVVGETVTFVRFLHRKKIYKYFP
ncbi:MAG TPA: type II toxin-antitoxin system RelE/ParE family toxin [Pyrinomonadaceae bacterium]|nr:type II toxin-antitoxin system RelE/ParE family toxin [Pyrinomonadaceae bacterium]